MNKLWATGALCALTVFTTPAYAESATTEKVDIPALQAEAKGVIKALAGHLGGELKKAADSSGLEGAIQVCNTKAAPITQQVSEEQGWTIGRTSLKLRNPDNTPDAWEQKVLEDFAQKAQIGVNLQKLAFSQVLVDENGNRVFRMMKAIPVADKCLACHGSEIKPAVAHKLDLLYPNDQARGFKTGDLRGAFSLKKTL